MADTPKTEKKKGRLGYLHAKADARKSKRQLEADQRQAKHDSLTIKEKIAKATKRGGSVRELKRLNELATKKPEPKAAPAPMVETKPAPKGTNQVSRYRQRRANN